MKCSKDTLGSSALEDAPSCIEDLAHSRFLCTVGSLHNGSLGQNRRRIPRQTHEPAVAVVVLTADSCLWTRRF